MLDNFASCLDGDPEGGAERLFMMNRVFSGLEHPLPQEFPLVNAWVGEGDVIATVELPGVDPEKMEVSVVGDTLTISGFREWEPLKEVESYHRQERSHGRFTRTLQIPLSKQRRA